VCVCVCPVLSGRAAGGAVALHVSLGTQVGGGLKGTQFGELKDAVALFVFVFFFIRRCFSALWVVLFKEKKRMTTKNINQTCFYLFIICTLKQQKRKRNNNPFLPVGVRLPLLDEGFFQAFF